jgi:hypothetical protein
MRTYFIFQTLLVMVITLTNCQNEKKTATDYYSNIKSKALENNHIINIELDSIFLNPEATSFNGFIRIYNDIIYYVDQTTCKLYAFNSDGELLHSRLGKGQGPQEFSARFIADYTQTPDGKHFFQGLDDNTYIYDENWTIVTKNFIDWQEKHSREEMMQNYDASMPGLYAINALVSENMKGRLVNNHIYYEVYSEHPTFNFIISEEYYSEGRIIAKLDYRNSIVKEIIGRRSLAYAKYKYLGHLSFLHFDTDGGNQFFLNFEIDSLIYICDKNFVPINSFGSKGNNMNTNYIEFNKFEDLDKRYYDDRQKCGFYTGLEYIQERELLFRSYTRGDHAEFDGLQIYKDKVLVADVDVPKGFKVEGYIAPYFYSTIFSNSEKQTIKTYRFTLDF